MEMDPPFRAVAEEDCHLLSRPRRMPFADVGGALGWPVLRGENLAIGAEDLDAGLVPDGVDGLPSPLPLPAAPSLRWVGVAFGGCLRCLAQSCCRI
jgi:hypothetical protein